MAVMQKAMRRFLGQIVYVGPGLSGKTTNLSVLAGWLPKTKMVTFATANDRTCFFDEVPVRVPLPGGWHADFRVQTVPGQVQFREGRERVLSRPDAIVFVADSDPRRMSANLWALEEVQEILGKKDRPLEEIPVVFQYNKQDVRGALSPAELDREINPGGAPRVLAEVVRGVGIVPTLRCAKDLARDAIVRDFGLAAEGGGS